jgi:hypothetical protein
LSSLGCDPFTPIQATEAVRQVEALRAELARVALVRLFKAMSLSNDRTLLKTADKFEDVASQQRTVASYEKQARLQGLLNIEVNQMFRYRS